MPKPVRVAHYPDQLYPTAETARATGAAFFRQFARRAVLAGAGAQALAGCYLSNMNDDPQAPPVVEPRITTAPTVPPEILLPPAPLALETVRLPEEGNASAWIANGYDDYMGESMAEYVVSFTTEDRAFAKYFRANETQSLTLVANALRRATCDELEADPTEEEQAVRDALEEDFRANAGSSKGIRSIELTVISCTTMPIAGGRG